MFIPIVRLVYFPDNSGPFFIFWMAALSLAKYRYWHSKTKIGPTSP